jgi:hypothetical protein
MRRSIKKSALVVDGQKISSDWYKYGEYGISETDFIRIRVICERGDGWVGEWVDRDRCS